MTDATRGEFVAFLQRLRTGSIDVQDWNRHALRSLPEPDLERARRLLVSHALRVGQCSARPVPSGIEGLVDQLLNELDEPLG